MEGWVAQTATLLEPLYDCLGELILASGYVQADETPIPVQDLAARGDRKSPKGKTHKGYYWVYHVPSESILHIDCHKRSWS